MSLKTEYFCFGCHTRQPKSESTFKNCSRCGIVQYCDKKCQTDDWPNHKNICKILKKAFDDKNFDPTYIMKAWDFVETHESYHGYLAFTKKPLLQSYEIFANLNIGQTDKACQLLENFKESFQEL